MPPYPDGAFSSRSAGVLQPQVSLRTPMAARRSHAHPGPDHFHYARRLLRPAVLANRKRPDLRPGSLKPVGMPRVLNYYNPRCPVIRRPHARFLNRSTPKAAKTAFLSVYILIHSRRRVRSRFLALHLTASVAASLGATGRPLCTSASLSPKIQRPRSRHVPEFGALEEM